jgi:hypothetical protein
MVSRQQPNPSPYERKFANLIEMLETSPDELIVIHHPEVLGDNYEELVESLNRIAGAGKQLAILPKTQRTPGVERW